MAMAAATESAERADAAGCDDSDNDNMNLVQRQGQGGGGEEQSQSPVKTERPNPNPDPNPSNNDSTEGEGGEERAGKRRRGGAPVDYAALNKKLEQEKREGASTSASDSGK